MYIGIHCLMISEQGMNKKPPFNMMLIKNKNKISKAF